MDRTVSALLANATGSLNSKLTQPDSSFTFPVTSVP